MAAIKSSHVTVDRGGRPRSPASDPGSVVVWLRGEHDLSTVAELSEALAQAITLDDTDVVVDLSEVRFMGVATVGVFRRARGLLRARSRGLVLRSPPGCVHRVLDLCGDADLLVSAASKPGALSTWVPVPAIDRSDRPADAAPLVLGGAPDPVSTGPLPAALAASTVAGRRDRGLTPAVAGPGTP